MSFLSRLDSFVLRPAKVQAGRITCVYVDHDSDDYPVQVWVDSTQFLLAESATEDFIPSVGDWLLIPVGDSGDPDCNAVVMRDHQFRQLFARPSDRSESARAAGLPLRH